MTSLPKQTGISGGVPTAGVQGSAMRTSSPQIGSRIGDEDIAATGRFELLL